MLKILFLSCISSFVFLVNSIGQTDNLDSRLYLNTGYYYIVNENVGVKLRLEKTDEFYYLDKNRIVGPENFNYTRYSPKNEYHCSFLAIVLDSIGAKYFEQATRKLYYGEKIGFIHNNKLIFVGEVHGVIKSGQTSIPLPLFNENEIQLIQNDIDSQIEQ